MTHSGKYLFFLSVIAGISIFYQQLNAQTFSFKNFTSASGIPDTYVYTLNQDNNGFLWVGTGSGLARLDGFSFHTVTYPDSITNRYPTVNFKDNTGRLWFGCSDGSLFYAVNGELVKYKDLGFQSINQIFQADDDYITIIPQEKTIVKIRLSHPDEIIRYYVPREIIMTCAATDTKGNLLLGTMQNLLYCRLESDSVKIINQIEGIEYIKIQTLLPVGEGREVYLIGTEGSGIFILVFENGKPVIKRFDEKLLPENLDVRSFYKGKDGNIWVSTFGSGLIKISLNQEKTDIESVSYFNSLNGLQGNDVRCVFEDQEENIWVGLYGGGLSMLLSQAISFYAPGEIPEKNNIISISQDGDLYFLGTPSGYYFLDPSSGKIQKFTDLRSHLNIDVAVYMYEGSSKIWAGTKGEGLFLVSQTGRVQRIFHSENSGQNYIRHINSDGRNLWLSTLDGIVVIDKSNGKLIKRFNIEDRLPHNSINQILMLRNGKALAATECDRLYRITLDGGVEIGQRIMSGTIRNKVFCYAESGNGDIWAGTAGNGLFWFTGDTINNINTTTGLFSNFCYSILCDSKGKIWIGHERGFSGFDPENGTVKIYSPDFMRNASCNPNSIIEDSAGKIIIGTTEGLITFDGTKEKKISTPPRTNIVAVTINNVRYPLRREYILPYSRYTIKIDYVGINLRDPEGVYYSTRLDNWDNKWSEMKRERQVTYQLRDGRYRFNLISYNTEGLSDQEPVFIDFYIKTPLWRTWWFICIALAVIAGTVIIIIKQREKAQEKAKRHLEEELEKRTSEVVKQKEKIELQNLEITDSINYARRIQASILPDINKLTEAFPESFIIFYPRDIVSGDFYWFERLDNDNFILVCADATGHGVPGAFMSMVGSTLVQDIITRQRITRPSQVLINLDKQLITTLKQNVDVEASRDGMDIVVCNINIPNRRVKFSSAMRPIIIIMQGELYYIKGNKYTIGGESPTEKYFDDQEYFLGEGDCIYFFSDGYPDQFGGEAGKKMKVTRFRSLLENVHIFPMSEQKEILEKFFKEWKDNYDQVDDVLVMGIKF